MANKKVVCLLFLTLSVLLLSMYAHSVNALPSTGSFALSDPTDDIYTTYANDDGYMPMRDLTYFNMTWDATALTITLKVATLTNTTAAWNNTGFTITIANGTDGAEWWPQYSNTHFNTTLAPLGQWIYAVAVQNVTAIGGLDSSYIIDSSYNNFNFTSKGVTVDIPTSPANTIIITVPWTAIGGMAKYPIIYSVAASFYCYNYGPAVTGDAGQKFLDLVSPSNDYTVTPQPTWGHDPDGFDKYEVQILDYNMVPEFPTIWLVFGTLAILSATIAVAKKRKVC
jgi:hypothetical protein